MTETEETKRGELLASVLGLKHITRGPDKGKFRTEWGTKTSLGLFRTTKRILQDGE